MWLKFTFLSPPFAFQVQMIFSILSHTSFPTGRMKSKLLGNMWSYAKVLIKLNIQFSGKTFQGCSRHWWVAERNREKFTCRSSRRKTFTTRHKSYCRFPILPLLFTDLCIKSVYYLLILFSFWFSIERWLSGFFVLSNKLLISS